MNNKKGFTLIELLVVIAIIGLLSTMSVLALNSARARARDAKRIADIKQIQTALEMYYNDNNTYPEAAVATTTALVPYLKTWPTAPLPVDGSLCDADKNTYTYTYYGGSGGT
ncbi:MAG TPA: prepilin-type N-terminal cleavage/methylation domain-containing protein, partial [bacterium]|nr:prepilin-type N-terminal cleavage/methylation domain-containing protein [bacterium]